MIVHVDDKKMRKFALEARLKWALVGTETGDVLALFQHENQADRLANQYPFVKVVELMESADQSSDVESLALICENQADIIKSTRAKVSRLEGRLAAMRKRAEDAEITLLAHRPQRNFFVSASSTIKAHSIDAAVDTAKEHIGDDWDLDDCIPVKGDD